MTFINVVILFFKLLVLLNQEIYFFSTSSAVGGLVSFGSWITEGIGGDCPSAKLEQYVIVNKATASDREAVLMSRSTWGSS